MLVIGIHGIFEFVPNTGKIETAINKDGSQIETTIVKLGLRGHVKATAGKVIIADRHE